MISILSICILLTSCDVKIDNNPNTSSAIESKINARSKTTDNTIEALRTNEKTIQKNTTSHESKSDEPLDIKDFTVTVGENDITLDTPYKDLKLDKEEKKIDNNYVGETTSGDTTYKNYMHQFNDFDIYVSNSYYDTKNRNFDEYYITQIMLKTSAFKTARGITVGAAIDEVVNLYGEGKKVESNGNVSLAYRLKDMEISFAIDKEQKVQSIILNIVVE